MYLAEESYVENKEILKYLSKYFLVEFSNYDMSFMVSTSIDLSFHIGT